MVENHRGFYNEKEDWETLHGDILQAIVNGTKIDRISRIENHGKTYKE